MGDTEATVAVEWEATLPAAWSLGLVLVVVHGVTGWFGVMRGRYAAGWLEAVLADRSEGFRVAVGGQYAPAIDDGELWRLATSVLLHGDGMHLLVNVVAVVVLGRVLEPWVGPSRFLAWFCAGGLAGSVASHLAGQLQSDGASGGAFALLGASAVVATRLQARLDPEDRRVLVPMLWGFLLLNLVLSFTLPFVDAAGHLGGLGLGLGLGWLGLRGARSRRWVLVEGAAVLLFGVVCLVGWAS